MLVYSILEGIEKNSALEEAVNENMYSNEITNIRKLPSTLKEAIEEFKNSHFVKEKLGTHIFREYLSAKENEWDEFNNAITDWEIKKYLERY